MLTKQCRLPLENVVARRARAAIGGRLLKKTWPVWEGVFEEQYDARDGLDVTIPLSFAALTLLRSLSSLLMRWAKRRKETSGKQEARGEGSKEKKRGREVR